MAQVDMVCRITDVITHQPWTMYDPNWPETYEGNMRFILLPGLLALSGCAGFVATQSSPPVAILQTELSQDAFVGCFSAKSPIAVSTILSGSDRIIHAGGNPMYGDMSSFTVTVTPGGVVEIRKGMWRHMEQIVDAAKQCLTEPH